MKKILSVILVLMMMLGVFNAAAASEANGVWLDFASATDEELEEAIVKIKAEQRARLKTKISFDVSELSVAKGSTAAIKAEVTDAPEGVKPGKITWTSSDPDVATCNQGNVKGVKNGSAVITAQCTLSDGTEISNECPVTVFTPVKSLQASNKNLSIGVNQTVEAGVTIQPEDATYTQILYESSDESVVTVSEDGMITGVGTGKATITASTVDGSGKSVSIAVTASKKDDRGITKKDEAGNEITIYGFKESKGSSFSKPEKGNTFILIDIEIVNKSSEELNISSLMSFNAYCDGYSCEFSFSALLNASRQMDGAISPGKKMKGQIAYEVPKTWKEIEIYVKPDYWFGNDVSFVLYNQ